MAADHTKGWRIIVVSCALVTLALITGWQLTKRVQASTQTSGQTPANVLPKFFTEQFAKSGQSAARADLMACRNLDASIAQGSDVNPEELAKTLTGTWQRRLTMAGVPVQTNSYLYYDMSSGTTGRAMMIDQVNLGTTPAAAHNVAQGHQAFIESVESGTRPGGELQLPSVSSAFWTVSLASAPAEARSQGHTGATVQLNGDYFGSGNAFPAGGLNFTEHGTFFKEGNSFVTLSPWISPSTGYTDAYTMDRVVIGLDPQAGIGQPQRPTLTYVNCNYQFVDSYVKISDAVPTVNGMSLEAAWSKLKANGQLDRLPAGFKSGKGPEPF